MAKRRDDPRTTAYFGGETVKTDLLMEVLGSLDELGSALALARSLVTDDGVREALLGLQRSLLELGAGIADPESRHSVGIGAAELAGLVEKKEALAAALPALQNFIVPGAEPGAAAIHLCRSVCRRAERAAQRLHEVRPLKETELEYVNQLSNYLFELVRRQAEVAGADEETWIPGAPEGNS
ncbi:MAG: cob(I)yrinic acid a,c-diamide adenosyltransferase [Chloroflexota bacterium]|nr:cob(I)yrinic acid a,c-diamide adenosyltransferase [Chloroflexota bacterium]MDP6758027.1 cob(I)yrinic acid a,c-diamide adenosyltransferase [Chloroflexota bacterium]